MPPKFDPNAIHVGKVYVVMIIRKMTPHCPSYMQVIMVYEYNYFPFILVYLRVVGGEVGATSSLAPKIGPLGLVSGDFPINQM